MLYVGNFHPSLMYLGMGENHIKAPLRSAPAIKGLILKVWAATTLINSALL
jgi:hypothetical protein